MLQTVTVKVVFVIVLTVCMYFKKSFIFHRMLDNMDLSSQVDEVLRET